MSHIGVRIKPCPFAMTYQASGNEDESAGWSSQPQFFAKTLPMISVDQPPMGHRVSLGGTSDQSQWCAMNRSHWYVL